MITFTCPACQGKCQVGDEFSGRKMRCPKCQTRIRHHKDGTIELLTVGNPPPVPAATAGAPPPPVDAPPSKDSTAVVSLVPELANKLLSQGESKQNTYVIWGVIGFLAVALGGIGMAVGDMILAVSPSALVLVGGFAWLILRKQKRDAGDARNREHAKTEAIRKL